MKYRVTFPSGIQIIVDIHEMAANMEYYLLIGAEWELIR